MNVYTARPTNPLCGDVMVFAQDDQYGRTLRMGRHTNYGYSGYAVIVVWDGKSWAALTRKFRESIGISTTEFLYRYEMPEIVDCVRAKLEEFADAHPDSELHSWWYKGRKYAEFVARDLVRSKDAHRGNGRPATEDPI